jgi:septum formation protein
MGLLLASASPRRRQLLLTAGVPLIGVTPANILEVPAPGEGALAYCRRLAREKALAAVVGEHAVLAADTVVHRDDLLFEKPLDDEDAARILRALSGGWHRVTTAFCLRSGPGRVLCLRQITTRVRFRALDEAGVQAYIASGEGRDKAGAYGIQGLGAALVDRVVGCHTNVVGLPLPAVLAALSRHGLRPATP